MAINKVVEIIHKGSPEWGKRFNARKRLGVGQRSALERFSISSKLGKNRKKLIHHIDELNKASHTATEVDIPPAQHVQYDKVSPVVLAKSTKTLEQDVILASTPENPIKEPPDEIPNNQPDELPPSTPQETPTDHPEELPHDAPQELPPGTPQETPPERNANSL